MNTITQRLREIAKGLAEDAAARRGLGLDKAAELYSMAAELEAPAADAAVPVVAWLQVEFGRTGTAASTRPPPKGAPSEIRFDPLVNQRDHLATVAALQARINALEARQMQPKPTQRESHFGSDWVDDGA